MSSAGGENIMMWLATVLMVIAGAGALICVVLMSRATRAATKDHTDRTATRFRSRTGIDGPRSTRR